MIIPFKNQTLHLHPLRAIFWEEENTLFLADLHLGKAAHFRKSGLAAPAGIMNTNLNNLTILLEEFRPGKVLFLGDLFHSTINQVWEQFSEYMRGFPEINFELVQGNHDILPQHFYDSAQLVIYTAPLTIGPFLFSHYPQEKVAAHLYNFYGHIHPGIRLSGFGGQDIRLPCYHFEKVQAVLPAFGAFTGLALRNAKWGDRVFVIAEGEVIEVG